MMVGDVLEVDDCLAWRRWLAEEVFLGSYVVGKNVGLALHFLGGWMMGKTIILLIEMEKKHKIKISYCTYFLKKLYWLGKDDRNRSIT